MKHLKKLVLQHIEKDCAVASVSMILSHYGNNVNYAELSESLTVDAQGTNILSIIETAENYGLDTDAYEGSSDEFFSGIKAGEITLPCIVRIVNNQFMEHFIVVSAVSKGKVYYSDPGEDKKTITKQVFTSIFLGEVICFRPNKSFKKAKGESCYKYISELIKENKKSFIRVCLFSLVAVAISLSTANIFKFMIDDLMVSSNLNSSIQVVLSIGFGLTLLYLTNMIINIVKGKAILKTSFKINRKLVMDFLQHILKLPSKTLMKFSTGNLLSRISELQIIQEAMISTILTLFIDSVCLLSGAILLCSINKSMFIVSLALALLYVIITAFYRPKMQKVSQEVLIKDNTYNSFLNESITGLETIKTFADTAENRIQLKANEFLKDSQKSSMKYASLAIGKDSILDFISNLSQLLTICIGVVFCINGNLTTGALIIYVTYLSFFYSPLDSISEIYSSVCKAKVALERMNEILDYKIETSDNKAVFPDKIKDIAITDVSFRYGRRNLILEDINIQINAGETVAFVGPSGGGKSTLTKLICGENNPEKGCVSVNGVPLSELSSQDRRKNILYLPQSVFLFSSYSLRENLTIGLNHTVSDEELFALLDTLECSFVHELPFGLESNPEMLSGGQKQRLALARALLMNPQILILDESTSNLDSLSQKKIMKNIRVKYPDLTIILIAHRLNTVVDCHNIFVIENGKITEQGTHDVLMRKNNGLYKKMFEAE